MKLLGSNLTGFIFEQEYQRKENRTPGNQMAHDLDKFLQMIPKDNCYHLELPQVVFLLIQGQSCRKSGKGSARQI